MRKIEEQKAIYYVGWILYLYFLWNDVEFYMGGQIGLDKIIIISDGRMWEKIWLTLKSFTFWRTLRFNNIKNLELDITR